MRERPVTGGGPLRVVVQSPSEASYVAVVRAALAGLAETAGLAARALADVQTSVSEACNNVVLRAYGDDVGPMRTLAEINRDAVRIVVSDRGHGFSDVTSEPRNGLGMAVIGALSDEVEFRSPGGVGTEVEMRFNAEVDLWRFAVGSEPPLTTSTYAPDQLRLWVTPVALLGRVLTKVAVLLAASAHFTISAVERVRLAAALIARYIELSGAAAVDVTFTMEPSRLAFTAPDPELPQLGQGADGSERARAAARQHTLQELAGAVDWLGHDGQGSERCLRIELRSG